MFVRKSKAARGKQSVFGQKSAVATAILAVSIAIAIPVSAGTPGKFTESDFYWDKDTSKYKPQIISVVNKIARENRRCKISIDPKSVMQSYSKSKPGDPIFFVACGSGLDSFNVWFRPEDADEGQTMAAKENIPKNLAIEACETAAKRRAAHPSSVDFSRFIDAQYIAHASGRSTLMSTFTAKNSFNMEAEFNIRCIFDGYELIEDTVSERK